MGRIENGSPVLSGWGQVADRYWNWLADQYDYVDLGQYVIMPNHLHGIIVLHDRRGASRSAPTKRKPLGRLIGAFKTVSTKEINIKNETPKDRFWQRNYHEHIIRDSEDLDRIRNYIINNPGRWEFDLDNPEGRPDNTELEFWKLNQKRAIRESPLRGAFT